jgi:hypothetical protein
MQEIRIFLGGTVGKNNWRESFTKQLVDRGYNPKTIFNPVVADWNAEAQAAEEAAKAFAEYHMYYIADPQQEGLSISGYSMVEATIALNDYPSSTVVVFDMDGMEGHALKAMKQTLAILKTRFPDRYILPSQEAAIDWFTKWPK